jgi:hypothetical protein
MLKKIYTNLSSEAVITNYIVLLIFLQYILLGYIGFFSSIIEVILLSLLFFNCNFKYQFKVISILVIFIIIYYYNSVQLSKEFFVSFKNILIFILVYYYFLKKRYYLFCRTESLLISLIFAMPIIGFLFPNINTNLSNISNLSYANNIFSTANLGLNFHFSTQIILGYFMLFYCYYQKFNSLGNFNFFFSSSKIILWISLVILFYILLNSSGTTTGLLSFIITTFFYAIFQIIKNKNLTILQFIIHLYFLAILLFIYLIIDYEIVFKLMGLFIDRFLFGSVSFKIIMYEFHDVNYFLSLATWLPTFVVDLDLYPRYIYMNTEISLIKHILEYGIILFVGIIFLINRKFSPVALFFSIALIHYSFLFTGICALLIAKLHNALYFEN